MTNRQKSVLAQVKSLYEDSERDEAHWMLQNHVQIVAQNALDLADKYKGNKDITYVGSLLHDLADVWYKRADPKFNEKSLLEAEKILKIAGFSDDERSIILNEVIEPHSCYPGNFPKSIEGQIVATADALAHLKTSLYYEIRILADFRDLTDKEYNTWVLNKIERDFNSKIFFDEIKDEARPFYEKLKKDFSL